MDMEQIIKRLEWLDEERRKDKTTIATLEDRLVALEGNLPAVFQQINELSSEISRLSAFMARLDQFEGTLAQMRVEFTRSVETVEKQRAEHDREVEKVRRGEMESLNKAIAEARKGADPIPEMRRVIQARQDEEFRLARLIEELEAKINEAVHSDEDYKRTLRLLDEGRRQDVKRLTDIQGEIASLRKRADEQRGKIDLNSDNLRRIETRLSELLAAESERRQVQTSFIEKQTLMQVERERTWKEWQTRFDVVEKTASGLDAQWQSLDATARSVKRSQEALDDVTQRFERRINEITEMQRLGEERFRQEWVTFKADDQKRWTNYTLASEELSRETTRIYQKYDEKLVVLDDLTQELRDMVVQINQETQKRLQSIVAVAHEWMSAYESAFGRTR